MKIIFHILILLLYSDLLAQDKTQNPERLIQEFIPEGEEIDPEYLENLIQLYSNPLDLNKATAEDLQELFILTPMQIQNFLEYRNESGTLLSLYELQVIPGFDRISIEKILPFITIVHQEKASDFFRDFFNNKSKYLLTRYEKRVGPYKLPGYTGDSHKILLSFRNYRQQHFSAGLLLEKDAGESVSWNPSNHYYGTDYHSWHFAIFNQKMIKTFLIGDYNLQFGQGLVLGTGFALAKGGETILTAKRNNKGISPHFSSMEFNYMRGSAVTIRNGPADFTAFFSSQNIDGNIQTENSFTRVFNGYHRSESELSKRKQIHEKIYGGNISVRPFSSLHIGLSGVFTHFEKPVAVADDLYRKFDFTGPSNFTGGVDLSFHWKNINLFGEHAYSGNKKSGTLLGMIISLTSALDLSCILRDYAKDFHSLYSNGFSEGGKVQNEKGIYWGIKYKPRKQWEIAAYADFFRFPWLKYQVSAPSSGQEYLGRATYFFSKLTRITAQARVENKEKDFPNEDIVNTLKPVSKTNLSLHMETSDGIFTLRSKVLFTKYTHATSKFSGFSIIQDLDIRLKKIVISARIALFDAKDFNSRMYVYERDVLYTFSMPFYYGNGMRNYLLVRYKLMKSLDIWVKFSGTKFFRNTSEERNDTQDIKMQLRYSF